MECVMSEAGDWKLDSKPLCVLFLFTFPAIIGVLV